jgi:hypothetical protein
MSTTTNNDNDYDAVAMHFCQHSSLENRNSIMLPSKKHISAFLAAEKFFAAFNFLED